MLTRLRKLTGEIEALHDGGLALGDIAAQLQLEYDAAEGLLYLPGYVADDGNYPVEYPDATDGHDAATDYVTSGDWGDEWKGKTFAHEVAAWRPALRVDYDGALVDVQAEHEHHLITRDPDEPECSASCDGAHRWAAPHSLVGGCVSNPGVCQANGCCSIVSTNVCVLCGLRRTTTTGNPRTYDSTEYGGGQVVLVSELVHLHDGRVPAGLNGESELAGALRDVVEDQLIRLGHEWECTNADNYEWTVAVRTAECERALDDLREILDHCSAECRPGSSDEDWQEIEIVIPRDE